MQKREQEVKGLQRVIFDSEQAIDTLTAERDDAQRRAENDWKLRLLLAACGFRVIIDQKRGFCLWHRSGKSFYPDLTEKIKQVIR
jgi:hypothetical protein